METHPHSEVGPGGGGGQMTLHSDYCYFTVHTSNLVGREAAEYKVLEIEISVRSQVG